jgi:asparagine synthase (glutamine-hydrolysing)
LLRDRFGIKPFYYIEKNGGFYFGSEYKPVKFSPLFSNNLNIEQVSRGLQLGWVCYEDETFFTDIKLLPAASNLVFENGSSKILEYWNIATAKPSIPNSFEERVDTFKSLLYNSTRLHMRSDVEVAVALSGGIDSSALTAIMCSLFPNQNVSSFSIYFDGKNDVDEREYMYEVVNKYKNIQPAYIKPDANYIEENLLNILSTSEFQLHLPLLLRIMHSCKK